MSNLYVCTILLVVKYSIQEDSLYRLFLFCYFCGHRFPLDQYTREPLDYLNLDDDPLKCLMGQSILLDVEVGKAENLPEKFAYHTFVCFSFLGVDYETSICRGFDQNASYDDNSWKIRIGPLNAATINLLEEGCISVEVCQVEFIFFIRTLSYCFV